MWLPGNGPWDSRCERGRDGDAERDKERPIKRGKRPRGARLWVPGRPWGPRCAPCLPTALLTTRRGPQAASGPAAASPHPHRRSPTCRWRPQSAHPALSGSVTWAGQGSGLQPPALPAPPPAPRGTPVPEEAHLLAAEPCHPGVGARGAQQAPRALRLIKHGEPRIPGADLHCRATGQPPGSPTRQSPPRLVSLLGGLALNPCRPDQRARGPPSFVTASGQVQSKIRGPGTSCPARNQGTFSCLVDS